MISTDNVISAKAGIQTVSEKTNQEQLFNLASAAAKLELLWLEDPDIRQKIDPDDWQRFMEALYQGLLKLQTEAVQK